MGNMQGTKHQDRPVLGMLFAFIAFFLLAVMQVFAKLLSEQHSVIELAFYRNLIGLIPFLVYIAAFKQGRDILIINENPKGVCIRSVLGVISLAITFGAFAAMPMADATAFLFTASLMVPALGFFFLHERVGPYRWSAILIGFFGVLVMLQPQGDVNTLGVSLALTAAVMHAVLQTLLRHLGKTESPETVTFYFIAIGTVVAALPMPFIATMPTLEEIPLIIALGISGTLAQFVLSSAYKYAEASIVTVFNYSGIIWATAFGWFIWNDWPTLPIWIGGTIVIASNLFIIWREKKLAEKSLP